MDRNNGSSVYYNIFVGSDLAPPKKERVDHIHLWYPRNIIFQ